jgi:hypothetical protein
VSLEVGVPGLLVECFVPEQKSNGEEGDCEGDGHDGQLEEDVDGAVDFSEEAHEVVPISY